MADTVTFRLDPRTARILEELTRRGNGSRSRVIKEALRNHWESFARAASPNAWQVYALLDIPTGKARRNRARRLRSLLREKLVAKRRNRTL